MFGGSVEWRTKKQPVVALSSTEAEFVSLSEGTANLLWVKGLLEELNFDCGSVPVFEDNQSCIKCLDKWEHNRLCHMNVKYNFVRDLAKNKIINVQYVNSENQCADIFTKALSGEKFQNFVFALGLV